MFDRGKPKESASPSSSPDRKTAPNQGSHMNNEQFGMSSFMVSKKKEESTFPSPILILPSSFPCSCVPPRSSQQSSHQTRWCETSSFSRVPPRLFSPVDRWPPFTGSYWSSFLRLDCPF